MITDSENILKVLSATNPWWKTGSIAEIYSKPFKRSVFYECTNILMHPDIRRFILLTGARRIGKTTIMYQMIEKLLIGGTAPNRIIYITFDHPLIKLSRFDKIIDVYQQYICPDKNVYYFFDEIQYADEWDSWLKTLYDSNPHCRAAATGSASPPLLEKTGESGVGRWSTLRIPTLTFYEYCTLLGIGQVDIDKNINPLDINALSIHEQTMLFQKLSISHKYFNRYLIMGGFPELALSKDELFAQRAMREDIVDKVLKRDIPELFNMRSIVDLEKIFLYLCYKSSGIISMDAISKELSGVTRPTVEKYIRYLESANLIYISDPIDLSGKRVLKSQPKIYIADAAIRNAVIMQDDILANPAEMGIIVETAVYKHLHAFYSRMNAKVGYYRGKSRDDEIDIVVEYLRNRILIEVKYRDHYPIGDKTALLKESGNANSALLITKREDDYGPVKSYPTVYRFPAYAFLYLLGCMEKNETRSII